MALWEHTALRIHSYLGLKVIGSIKVLQTIFGVMSVIFQVTENFYAPIFASLMKNNRLNLVPNSMRIVISVALVGAMLVLICLTVFVNDIVEFFSTFQIQSIYLTSCC